MLFLKYNIILLMYIITVFINLQIKFRRTLSATNHHIRALTNALLTHMCGYY